MKQTIALIDDDRNILTSLSMALEKKVLKCKLTLMENLLLQVYPERPPDLAVIDIKMPKWMEKNY